MIELEKLYIGKEVYGLMSRPDWDYYECPRSDIKKENFEIHNFIIEELSSRKKYREGNYITVGVCIKGDSNRHFEVYLNDIFETKRDVFKEQIKLLNEEKDRKLKEIGQIEILLLEIKELEKKS